MVVFNPRTVFFKPNRDPSSRVRPVRKGAGCYELRKLRDAA